MRLNISIQQYDKPLLFICLALCAFGTIMLYSASWNESFVRSGGSTESLFLKGQILLELSVLIKKQNLLSRMDVIKL